MPNNKPLSRLPNALLNQLLIAMPPVNLRPERAALIKQNLLSKAAFKASITLSPNEHSSITTVRAGSGDWLPQMPGIETQILFDDGLTMTWLARFKAGVYRFP